MTLASLSWREAKAAGHSRAEWIAAVSPKPKPKQPKLDPDLIEMKREAQRKADFPCIHRGIEVGGTPCVSCGEKIRQTYACAVHQACIIEGNPKDRRVKTCATCMDRTTGGAEIPFESFVNKYEGKQGLLIGRGPTDYDWTKLAEHDGPIFAVNDAALHVEKFTKSPDTFMLAQDMRIAPLVPQLRSVCIVPYGGQYGFAVRKLTLPSHCRISWITRVVEPGRTVLLNQTREELAVSKRLFKSAIKPKPTTVLAIHFAWFCGVSSLKLIGCDGTGTGYNRDMENASNSPETVNPHKYAGARKADEQVLEILKMRFTRG